MPIPRLSCGITLPGKPDLENARKLDVAVIPMIRRMMRAGMMIDKPYLQDLGLQFAADMRTLSHDISSHIPPEALDKFVGASVAIEEAEAEASGGSGELRFNPASAEQIGKLLFDTLALHVGRDKLKMTKGGRLSTGKRQLEILRHSHPVVIKVLAYREVAKLKSTYTDGLVALARFHPRSVGSQTCPRCELHHDIDQWRVHGTVGTTRAATWRFNHKNPNLGNIPTRTENGRFVQCGFVAPPGKVLKVRDLSQIELRCLAHLSNCRSMVEAYDNDEDLHTKTCYETGLAEWGTKPTIEHRMAAKRCGFGIMNGSTKSGLFLQLVSDFGQSGLVIPDWLTEDWCDVYIGQWLEAKPEVRTYFDTQHYRARRYKMVWNSFGFTRPVPEVQSTHSWIREAGLRQAQNMPITSLAAGQMKLAMARCEEMMGVFYDEGSAWPLMTIHDALIHEVDERWVEEVDAVEQVAFDECMDDCETGERMFRVPIKSDGDQAVRWVK